MSLLLALQGSQTYVENLSDTGTGLDSVLAVALDAEPLVDAGSGTDSMTQILLALASVSDAGSGLDSPTSTILASATVSDSGSGTDSLTGILVLGGTISDTGLGSDSLNQILANVEQLSDSGSGLDSSSNTVSMVSGVSDSGSGADADQNNVSVTHSILDTGAGLDAVQALALIQASIGDTGSGLDSSAGIILNLEPVSDSAAVTDAVLDVRALVETVADTAAVLDNPFTLVLMWEWVADAGAGTDQADFVDADHENVLDQAQGTDFVQAVLRAMETLTDDITVDTSGAQGTQWRNVDNIGPTPPAGDTIYDFTFSGDTVQDVLITTVTRAPSAPWKTVSTMPVVIGNFGLCQMNNFVYAVGGVLYNDGVYSNDVWIGEVDSSGNLGKWRRSQRPLPEATAYCDAFVNGQYMFVFGGKDQDEDLVEEVRVARLDPATGEVLGWQNVAPMIGGAFGQRMIQFDNTIYSIGGLTGDVYSLRTNDSGGVVRGS